MTAKLQNRMLRRSRLPLATTFVLSIVLFCSLACRKSPEPSRSAEPEPRAITTSSSPTPTLVAPGRATPTPAGSSESPRAPKTDEVVEAMTRVFNQTVSLDETHAPSFVVGD